MEFFGHFECVCRAYAYDTAKQLMQSFKHILFINIGKTNKSNSTEGTVQVQADLLGTSSDCIFFIANS